MKTIGYNISMIRGDSEVIRVSCRDENGVSVPLVDGDTVYFTVKSSTNIEEKKLQKVITSFLEGEALIILNPSDTKQLFVGTYYYDVQLNRGAEQVKTIIPPSLFTIDPEVTYE